MGTVTLNKTNRMYWLGRYLERVYTTLKATRPLFDAYTDDKEADFAAYCTALGISADYRDTADFINRYYFDTKNPSSVAASLGYAYDNAIVLREMLSSETLAYVQMAVSAMELAAKSSGPAVELQWVLDDIMAFRGACEEKIADEKNRSIIKTGISQERVDLYLRLGCPKDAVRKEFERLFNRLYKAPLEPAKEPLALLVDALLDTEKPTPPVPILVQAVEGLFPNI